MIREYEPGDIEGLIKVWRNASAIAHSFLSSEFLEKEEQLMRYIYLDEAETWVYETGGKVAGFIAMIGNDVGGLFVDPEFQRGGIGKELLDFIKGNHPLLTVDVFKENPIGCAFYRKYGFEIVNELMHKETGQMLYRMKYVVCHNRND